LNLPKNSVGTKQLKNGAVTAKKIKNGAVTAAKINTSGLTAPNALHANAADSATNAISAGHASVADNATNAGTASTLDGLQAAAFKVSCPSDTTLVAGECIETKDRPATDLIAALAGCAAAGRRLAPLAELWAFGRANPTAMTAEDWADSIYYGVPHTGGSAGLIGMALEANGGASTIDGGAPESTILPYRCVTEPSN
jgi:hypothetical protein